MRARGVFLLPWGRGDLRAVSRGSSSTQSEIGPAEKTSRAANRGKIIKCGPTQNRSVTSSVSRKFLSGGMKASTIVRARVGAASGRSGGGTPPPLFLTTAIVFMRHGTRRHFFRRAT